MRIEAGEVGRETLFMRSGREPTFRHESRDNKYLPGDNALHMYLLLGVVQDPTKQEDFYQRP